MEGGLLLQLQLWTNGTLEEHLPATTFGQVKSSTVVGLRDRVAIIRALLHVMVKSSQVVGLRDRVAIIRALLHAFSSPHPYAGYGDLNGVGRRRNLSEAACYRNWPRSR